LWDERNTLYCTHIGVIPFARWKLLENNICVSRRILGHVLKDKRGYEGVWRVEMIFQNYIDTSVQNWVDPPVQNWLDSHV
jgi:hypothetical protein